MIVLRLTLAGWYSTRGNRRGPQGANRAPGVNTYICLDFINVFAHLTGANTREALLAGSMAGALFENFVVQEAMKAFAHAGLPVPLFYYRTNNGLEVDLLIEHSPTAVTPIEIKLAKTPRSEMARGIERLRAMQGARVRIGPGYVACMADAELALSREDRAVSWRKVPEIALHPSKTEAT